MIIQSKSNLDILKRDELLLKTKQHSFYFKMTFHIVKYPSVKKIQKITKSTCRNNHITNFIFLVIDLLI